MHPSSRKHSHYTKQLGLSSWHIMHHGSSCTPFLNTWVGCAALLSNQVTSGLQLIIKIWNLTSGELWLLLTGHISTVCGLAVSPHHPYLFSCGEDKVCLVLALFEWLSPWHARSAVSSSVGEVWFQTNVNLVWTEPKLEVSVLVWRFLPETEPFSFWFGKYLIWVNSFKWFQMGFDLHL